MRASISAVPASVASSASIQLGQGDLGQESEAAEIDAEDRHVRAGLGDPAGHADQRAVAAEHHHQVARRSAARRAYWSGGQAAAGRAPRFRSRTPRARRAPRASRRAPRATSGGRIKAALGDQTDPSNAISRTMEDGRRWTEDPTPGGNGGRILGCLRCRRWATRSRPTRINPSASAAAATSSITRACTAGSRTSPPLPTSSRPASNCGFTSATTSAPGARSGTMAGRTCRSEMNETSIVTMSKARASCGKLIRRQRARVDALDDDDPRIGAQSSSPAARGRRRARRRAERPAAAARR